MSKSRTPNNGIGELEKQIIRVFGGGERDTQHGNRYSDEMLGTNI